jgi:hypothetical protein
VPDALPPAALGALTAKALRGVWRATPPPPAIDAAELNALAPHLQHAGLTGVLWWAMRGTPALADGEQGAVFRDVFHRQALDQRLHEVKLGVVLDLARELRLDPLLLKGWTVARRYPSPGLRPCGDVDLVVPAADHVRFQAALNARVYDRDWIDVDLEHRFLTADATPVTTLLGRSAHARVEGREVRVAGAADQLRLVSVHYLRAGGWQPRALCDIALLLETAPPDLDWDVVLGDRLHRNWVTVAAGLAADLLGADLSDTPLRDAAAAVPAWVRAHVIHGFGTTAAEHHRWHAPLRPTLRPTALAAQLRERWPPDGLDVTLHHRRRISPRSPRGAQAYDAAYRAAAMVLPVRLRRARRDGSPEVAG